MDITLSLVIKTSKCNASGIVNWTQAQALEAVKNNGYALKYVKEQTSDICLEAVKSDGDALKYVKEQTPDICLEAVKKCGYALKYVNPHIFPDHATAMANPIDDTPCEIVKDGRKYVLVN
jgi:hypothetical protein